MKLTKTRIDNLETPRKDCFIWDDELPGFGLRVSPRGYKSFMLQYRWQGRTRRVSIGRIDLITADKARKAARIMLGEIASGKNPALVIQQTRKAPTLETISKRFLKEHVAVRLKPTTQANYKQILRKYILPNLGTRRVNDVTRDDISKLHFQYKDIPCQANGAVRVLSKIFNLCEQWGLLENGSNPCRHIQLYKENRRNRFLSDEELAGLWETLESAEKSALASSYAVSAYKLLILTGCRLGEIRTMKWSYIKDNRVEFPDTKTGFKRIPLNKEAMEVLRQTPRKLDNEYVICGDVPGQPIINLQKSWRRIRKAADLNDVRIHDLRHTFASHAVMGGTPLALVSKLLGHTQISTTMRYAHLADAELAKASEGIGGLLKPATNTNPKARAHLKLVKS